jgi:serine/threonine protein kinase
MPLQDDSQPDYGEFVASDKEGEIEHELESRERYYNGLYYPIYIGEVLHQIYRIEHKLGHGGFSTVWMAHDLQKRRDVALKILVPGAAGENEFKMQNEIIQNVQDISNLLVSQESFFLPGTPGHQRHHRVFVFPMRGPSLGTCLMQLSIATRMSAARQVLKALACLHGAGIVHRGRSILT